MTRPATRDLLVYGDLGPECPFLVLRVPARGVPWRRLMQAAARLVKLRTETPRNRPSPFWNVEGDSGSPPVWTMKAARDCRYVWDGRDFRRYTQ